MLLAKTANGGLILGLSRLNIERLLQGKPIRISEQSHKFPLPPGVDFIAIVFGETEADILRELRGYTRHNVVDDEPAQDPPPADGKPADS